MSWLLFLIAASNVHADISKTDWVVSKGKLTYHVSFPLKNIEGVSESAKGKGHCDDKNCEFLIAAPLKSFQSGDGNRDNHMLEVTKAGPNPMVTVRVRMPQPPSLESFAGTAEIGFAGQTHSYPVTIKGKPDGTATNVSGTVPLKLSDFKVERPSLLGVRIDDSVPVDFDLRWVHE